MKTLKELGLAFKDVKAVCNSFNASGLTEEKVSVGIGVKGEAMLIELVQKIDTVADDKVPLIPADVQALYDGLPDAFFNQNVDPTVLAVTGEESGDEEGTTPAAPPVPTAAGKGKKKDAPVVSSGPTITPEPVVVNPDDALVDTTHQSECPIYGKGWSAKEKECQDCNKTFHKDYVNCKRMVKGITTVKDSKKPSKPRTGSPRIVTMSLSRYGHRINSMAGIIDDLVWAGTHFDTIVATLMAWHGRDEAPAKSKLRSHLAWLMKDKGITIVNTAGVLKAEQEFSIEQNAENTEAAIPSVEQVEAVPATTPAE